MKTTLLTAAVLMALSFKAYAETRASEFEGPRDAQAIEAQKAKEAEDAAKTAADKAAKAKEAAAKAQKEADEAKAKAAKSTDEGKNANVTRNKIQGFKDNDGIKGELEIITIKSGDKNSEETVFLNFKRADCTSGNCVRGVPFDKKTMGDVNDLQALADALGKKSDSIEKDEDKSLTASEKRRRDRKKELEKTEVTEKDVREEIASMLEDECGIDEEKVKGRRSNLDSRELRIGVDLESALSRTRFAGLQIPEKGFDSMSSDPYKTDAECSANVLKEFMDQHEEAVDVGDLKDKLSDLKRAESELKRQLRKETSPREIKIREKQIETVKAEIKKYEEELTSAKKIASAYDKVTTTLAKKLVINPSVSELATHKYFTGEDFFLHDLAATTSDSFKGVRKAAAQSLFDIYRLQSQSYLAYTEMANKATDPAQKLQFQQAALHYQTAGVNYNSMMSSSRFQRELFNSATQAGLDGRSVVGDIYNTYTPAAQQITSYLGNLNANGTARTGTNQALPQLLMVNSDGTYTPVTIDNQNMGGANGRGGRVLPASLINGGNISQNGSTVQLVRPVPQAPNGTMGVQGQSGIMQQPIIQQQPLINNSRGRK